MKFTILSIALVVVGIILLACKRNESSQSSASEIKRDRSFNPDPTPDNPTPFGYKCVWFVVKSSDSEDVAKTFGLKSPVRCNWKSGIMGAYRGNIFVSPPVNGWIFIVGDELPTLDDPKRKKETEALLTNLSSKYDEAQQYASHRIVGLATWAKASGGIILREYSYLGESGEVLFNIGEKTKEEVEAGIKDGPDFFPGEEEVMNVAGKWSINPQTLNENSASPSIGWCGNL